MRKAYLIHVVLRKLADVAHHDAKNIGYRKKSGKRQLRRTLVTGRRVGREGHCLEKEEWEGS